MFIFHSRILTVFKAERKKHINTGSIPLRRQVQYEKQILRVPLTILSVH